MGASVTVVEEEEPFRVGISGSYGGLNLGDEAILESIVTQLRQAVPVEITVFSRNAEDTLRRHRVDRAVQVREFSRNEILPEIERLDLFILGGGGILFDSEAKIYLREVKMAQDKGVPVMVYSIGVGPLRDPANQEAVRECLTKVEVLTVREIGARKLLEEIGVHREIRVTADPALLLQPEPLPPEALAREGLDRGRHLIGMSVREPGGAAPDMDERLYHALLANAADFMVDRFDADVILVPMEPRALDIRHSHAVISQMLRARRATVLRGEYTAGQMLSLVSHFDFAVGMRLHFLIFAALQGVTFVALPYASKVAGFLAHLKLDMPPIHEVNAGRLIAHIDHSWDRRAALKAQVQSLLPELQQRARDTNALAVALLRESRAKRRAGA
ncbi:MAG: polysaccharide pyruvyl transferase family protein [Deltaproteobacteria bacterium]|nr:polysaccharide pyruvyl transferase family protein [Deltaproteobacteria bacterium]